MIRPTRALLAALAAAAVAAGCSDDRDPVVIEPSTAPAADPAYDPTLEPAAAVLAVVPADATVLEVTDFEQVRYQLGYGELSSEDDKELLEIFQDEADATAPLLSRGILRESGYAAKFDFTQDDVTWEAHFDGPSGEGYVVAFRDDLDMSRVQRAADADEGPLAGATVVPAAHLAALGATRDPEASWAADPELTALVGQVAAATYVSRECLEDDELGATEGLEPLGPFSVSYGGELVTVRLGAPREDSFVRARLADEAGSIDPAFAEAYVAPTVADPQGGRIGYQLGDGPEAVRLAQEGRLPFAVCSVSS